MRVRQELEKQKARALVVAMLDEVAWLFNLRGADIEFNPVFFAYAVVTADSAILFVNPDQVSQDVLAQLGQEVQLRPYDAIIPYLKELGSDLQVRFVFTFACSMRRDSALHQAGQKVLIGDKTSVAVAEAIGLSYINIARSPIAELKAIKNATEVEGFRACHIRDGAALVRYFAWLEGQLNQGVKLSESQGADQLEKFRS